MRKDKNVFETILQYGHDEGFTPVENEDFTPPDAPAGSRAKIDMMAQRIQMGLRIAARTHRDEADRELRVLCRTHADSSFARTSDMVASARPANILHLAPRTAVCGQRKG